MAYLRPPLFQRRFFNPLAMRAGIGGATTLAVAGRRSGQVRTIPVIPIEHDGARYLVSTRGEAEWVRNLRAAGKGELRRRGRSEPFSAEEVPVAERPPVLAAYRVVAGRVVKSYFAALPEPADHPVFRITSRQA
jgi:deazaflavin-dependent oxidoreductase (nitroreductase family)